MQKFLVDGHEASFLPEGNWKLAWADEFDGTELDRSKWDYRLHMMGKRHRTWCDDGVVLDGNSNAVFKIYEKDGEVYSSQLQTGYNFMDAPVEKKEDCWGGSLIWPIGNFKKPMFLHKYGYYECRCRLQKMPGWWSAFWVQSPSIGCDPDPEFAGIENDIMESFEPGKIIQHSNHYSGYGDDHKCAWDGKGLDLDKEVFHTFGMLWDENGYIFYVDGKEDGRVPAPVSRRPEFILISTEVKGYRTQLRGPEPEAFEAARAGDTFLVDYVRVFDRI